MALCVALPAFGQANGGAPAASGIERFVGTWRYAGTPEQGREIIHRAVDYTVEPMNFITRGFAAGRLRDKNQLIRNIEIAAPGDSIRVTFDGERTYQTPPNQWRVHTFQGEDVNVVLRPRGDVLVQLFRSESGLRRNVYRLVDDDTMHLEVTVQSDQIPRDMRYRLEYRRR